MINDPSVPDEELEFYAAALKAQGILDEVVYELTENTDADQSSAFFAAANALIDAPTVAVLGLEEEPAADAKAEAEVINTIVTSHTYDFDAAQGITSDDVDAETYGKAASVYQEIKCGSQKISQITWAFELPDIDKTISFLIEATADGDDADNTFKLPDIEVNGGLKIGIVLENWAADERVIQDPEFITTTFDYEAAADEPVVDESAATDETDNGEQNVDESVTTEPDASVQEPTAQESSDVE